MEVAADDPYGGVFCAFRGVTSPLRAPPCFSPAPRRRATRRLAAAADDDIFFLRKYALFLRNIKYPT